MTKIQRAVVVIFFLASLALSATAFAGKPSGGGGTAGAYAPTLTTSLQSAAAPTSTATSGEGTSYTVSGCGYDPSYGWVTVEVFTPFSAAWVAEPPDANGCITVTNFSTVGHGTYTIDAWQHVKNKDQVVAQTTFSW